MKLKRHFLKLSWILQHKQIMYLSATQIFSNVYNRIRHYQKNHPHEMTNRNLPWCWYSTTIPRIVYRFPMFWSNPSLCSSLVYLKFSGKNSKWFCKKWTLRLIIQPRCWNFSIILVTIFHINKKSLNFIKCHSKIFWSWVIVLNNTAEGDL